MPSSSARCSQLPRAADKLPFYVALHKLRDHLRGDLPDLSDTDVTFPDLELKVEPKKEKLEVKQEIEDSAAGLDQTISESLTVGMKMENGSFAGRQKRFSSSCSLYIEHNSLSAVYHFILDRTHAHLNKISSKSVHIFGVIYLTQSD